MQHPKAAKADGDSFFNDRSQSYLEKDSSGSS